MEPSHSTVLWSNNKETIRAPKLVKVVKKHKQLVVVDKATNSWYLNIFLLIFGILFGIFFLYNCKNGYFKTIDEPTFPEPYNKSDLVYKLQ